MARIQALRGVFQLAAAVALIVALGLAVGNSGAEAWVFGAITAWVALVMILIEGLSLRADSASRIAAWALVALGGFMIRENLEDIGWALPMAFGTLSAVLVIAGVYRRRPRSPRNGGGQSEGRSPTERESNRTRRRPGKRPPSQPGDGESRPRDHRTVT